MAGTDSGCHAKRKPTPKYPIAETSLVGAGLLYHTGLITVSMRSKDSSAIRRNYAISRASSSSINLILKYITYMDKKKQMDKFKQRLEILSKYYTKNFYEVMDAIKESDPVRWDDLYKECMFLRIKYTPKSV